MQQNLTKSIFFGFFFGIIAGILTGYISNFYESLSSSIVNIFDFGGSVFLKVLKMLVVPIVFFSLVSGVANLNNIASLGRIGLKTLSLYIFTTILAITISLSVGNILDPGSAVSVVSEEKILNINFHPHQLDQFF